MTKQETVKIMAMLDAFYGQSQGKVNQMATVWHLILRDYDYESAKEAIIRYAKNDKREYAIFPPPSKIVEVIEAGERIYRELFNAILFGTAYDKLSITAKAIIDKGVYTELLLEDKEELKQNRQEIIKKIKANSVLSSPLI